jgi:hypothetical protein
VRNNKDKSFKRVSRLAFDGFASLDLVAIFMAFSTRAIVR